MHKALSDRLNATASYPSTGFSWVVDSEPLYTEEINRSQLLRLMSKRCRSHADSQANYEPHTKAIRLQRQISKLLTTLS